MPDKDDKFEEMLQSLEEGEEVKKLLDQNDGSEELNSLIGLAASIRDLPHPEIDRTVIQSEKQKIIAATRKRNRLNQRQQRSKVGGFTGQWLFVPAAAGLALILLMVFVFAAGAGFYIAGPRGAHTAVLMEASGNLEVSDSGLGGDWHAVSNGDKLHSGQRLRSGAGSFATIEFFDGTQTTLAPNTDLMLEKIDGDWGNVLQVELIQNSGQTDHGVVPLRGKESTFNVYTPSGTASVKGTQFKVLVGESGKAIIKVDHGAVLVTNDGSQEYIRTGQGLASVLGEPLSDPGYLFTLQGQLTSQVDDIWTVAGFDIVVPEDAEKTGEFNLNDNVIVQGQIQDQYDWIADSVQLASTPDQTGDFTGLVNYVSEDGLTWQVNGIDFSIDGSTLVGDYFESGDAVRVTFSLDEQGEVLILGIDLLDEDEGSEEKDPEAESPATGDEQPVEGGASCVGVDPHPKAVKLLADYPDAAVSDGADSSRAVTEEEIMGWFCNDRLGFGEIELAFKLSASSEMPVDEIIALRLKGQGWGLIKQYLDELPEDDNPEDEEASGEGEEDPDDDGDLDDAEQEDSDEDGDKCTGTGEHPKANKLETDYAEDEGVEVTAGEIMGWFCELNFGFGEIDLMLGLSSQYGEDVPVIITMRQGGLGWGQIRKELAEKYESVQENANPSGKVPPGKEKSEQNKNKPKPNKKGDD